MALIKMLYHFFTKSNLRICCINNLLSSELKMVMTVAVLNPIIDRSAVSPNNMVSLYV